MNQGIAERKHEMIAAIVRIIFEASLKGSALEEAAMSLNPADRKKFLTEKEGMLLVLAGFSDKSSY